MSNKKNIKTKLICIDGADNTGKSTLIEYMKQQEEFKNSNTLFLSFPTDEFRKNRDNSIISVDNNNFGLYLNDIVSNLFTEVFKNEYDYIVCDRSYLSTYIYNYIYGFRGREEFLIEYTYNNFMYSFYTRIRNLFNKYLKEFDTLDVYQVVLLSISADKLTCKGKSEYKDNNTYETAIDLNKQLQNKVNWQFKLYCDYFKNDTYLTKFTNSIISDYEFSFKITNSNIYVDNLVHHGGKTGYVRKTVDEIYNEIIKTKCEVVKVK